MSQINSTNEKWAGNSPPAGLAVGITLGFAGFMPVLVITTLSPAVPALIHHFAGIPQATTLIPLLVTMPGLVVALLAPLAGIIVDRLGKRGPLLLATACYVVAGLAPLLFGSILAISISRIVVGACEAFVVVSVNALLADYFDPDQRRQWLAIQGFASAFAIAGVVTFSGILTGIAWNGAFAVYALILPIWASIFFLCPEPARRSHPALHVHADASFPWLKTTIISGVTIFACAMFYVYFVQVALLYEAVGLVGSEAVGRYIGLASLSAPLGAVLFNILARRIRAEGAVATCLGTMAVGLIVMGSSRTTGAVLAGSLIHQVSAGMLIPALIYWVASVYEPQHRGKAFGIWSSASFASQFISPLLIGVVRAACGNILETIFILGWVTAVAALAMAVLVRHPLQLALEW